MADPGASVLARLKNKAAETGRSNQLCIQLFCQEEFLRRLERSRYAENFVLKGGLFLYSMTNYDSRVTADVDFLLWQMPNTPEKLRAVLEEIISTDTGNDFIFTFDEAVLSEALKKTFINRGRRFTMEQFRQIMTFEADDGMQKKWRAFTKKIGAKEIDFKNVLETIRTFLEVPFQAAVSVP